MKKLQICMKNYDYKDETKDVRGKVSELESVSTGIDSLLIDRKVERN